VKWDMRSIFGGISGLAVIVGVVILLGSTGWGNDAANSYLRNQSGGTMDTAAFMSVMQNDIIAYRQLGTTLLAGGIAGLLVLAWRRLR